MTEDKNLDQASQFIANARVAALKLGVSPKEIGDLMMDEATLGLMAEGNSLSDIQGAFKRYSKRKLPRFYASLKKHSGL